MRIVVSILLVALGGAASAADLSPPQSRAVEAFMEMVSARLGPGDGAVAGAVRARLETLTRLVSHPNTRGRFTAHFAFWPRPDPSQRIEEFAEDYLTHLDRAFTARERDRGPAVVDRHLARALRAVGEAHAWSTSTLDLSLRPPRAGLIRRYLAEAAVVWASVATIAGLEWTNGGTLGVITGGAAALAGTLQNLNFWWTARRAAPVLPPDAELHVRGENRLHKFWAHLAEFFEGTARARTPAELDAFATAQFDQMARLGGGGLRGACERLLAEKSTKTRHYK